MSESLFNKAAGLKSTIYTAQNTQFPADLVTFTEETLNGKLYFLCNKSGLGAIYQDCKNLLL